MNRVDPKLSTGLDSHASWQIVRIQCSGFRVDWISIFQDKSCSPKVVDLPRLASTRMPLGKSCEFSVQGSGSIGFQFFKINRVHPKLSTCLDSPRLACLLANRASSVLRVQGGLDFNVSR
jgi:hypothetical protein